MTVPAVATDWNLSALSDSLTDPSLSYSDFEGLCERLGNLYAAVKWADAEVKLTIGDAILAGEMLYGEEAHQAFEKFEVSEETRRECVRIARQVPRSIRKVGRGLSWSHLRAVASLQRVDDRGVRVPDVKAQREWLKRATEEGLSHHALRDMLRDPALRNGSEPAVKTCPICHRPL